MAQSITFIVPGHKQETRGATQLSLLAGLTEGKIKHSIQIDPARGAVDVTRIDAKTGEDVVVLQIVNGPILILHPVHARDLFMAQSNNKRRNGQAAPDEIVISPQLQWRGLNENIAAIRGASRGILGQVILSAVQVITGFGKGGAAGLVATAVIRRIDEQVDPGIYHLTSRSLHKLKGSDTKLDHIPAITGNLPILILIHGTFSNISGTFGKFWANHPQRVQKIFEHYANRVYGFDHPTLEASPITNALALVSTLPNNARLHLLTHSRGGLVAEVLARVCANANLAEDDYSYFKGDAYKVHREELKSLAALIKEKSIRVERIVRVACPARGTLLASMRLDAYISVFNWTLEAAGIPVMPEMIQFLAEVARQRAEPAKIPGLAAQIPGSPLIEWLHAVDDPIPGQLRVVAGDIEGDSVTSWLKTLLADAYYWMDNDLVVQTRSMYGGAARSEGASFFFDQGGKVSHFNYFSNERTVESIANALMQDTPAGFRMIGPLSWAGEVSSGERGRRFRSADGKSASEKPAVFILPGILGSNLKVNGKRIWLGLRLINGFRHLKYDPARIDDVKPDGLISTSYDDLSDFLSESHEVLEFAYDWRKPMEEEARRLAGEVETALDAREKSGQPVRLLAHSMGGLLARVMQMEAPHIWKRMIAQGGARVLMLGTPNSGSWAPMQVLSGDDSFGNTLASVGAPFQDHVARDMMAKFPGFIQLQAELLNGSLGLDKEATWKKLADDDLNKVKEFNWWHDDVRQLRPYTWGIPSQAVLDQAVKLRKALDKQRDKGLDELKNHLVLVVGKARFTPDGYEIGNEGLVYLDAKESGDGRVTLQNALLPGVLTWALDCEHGKLPDQKKAFEAYRELLEHGNTTLLSSVIPASSRGHDSLPPSLFIEHVRSRPAHLSNGVPPHSTKEWLALPSFSPSLQKKEAGQELRISVINGNLKFVREPLMVGHYRATMLTGTERVMDQLIGGAMTAALGIGGYPDRPGDRQVFVNNMVNPDIAPQLPRPEAVIVVGLGQEGKLEANDLINTVRQGVIAWAQHVREVANGAPSSFELASTLMGSGGAGISAGKAARLIAQAILEANERLVKAKWPYVSHLRLIELYLDRATDAWRALQVLATASEGRYIITETVQAGTGPLRRPLDSSYRGTDYDLISAVTHPDSHGGSVIAYSLDTKRARAEVQAQSTQGALLRDLVVTASNEQSSDNLLGRTLFQLLIPVEMEQFLGGTTAMQIELDANTAGIPWEMLDTSSGTRNGGDPRPWAIRAKLLRRLRTADFRKQVVDAESSAHVLVIGEPKCDEKRYLRLPGAREEAKAVVDRLEMAGAITQGKVKPLIRGESNEVDARTVITTLLSRDWRIVHIAGHGEPPEKIASASIKQGDQAHKDGDPRGVVLSNGIYLGPREINTMRIVPELVFVNCCHLAATDPNRILEDTGLSKFDRPGFAASTAEALIRIGVRCVIAAGWAVDDNAAKVFAVTFYDALLDGDRFINAMAKAREAAWNLGGNTWAAYQCYGDPNWSLQPDGKDANRPPLPLAEEFAIVASPPALILALETITVNSQFEKEEHGLQRNKIQHLDARHASRWGSIGAVAEAFGLAWAAVDDYEKAIAWLEASASANDGSASIKALEQLGNLRARLAWESVRRAMQDGKADVSKAISDARLEIEQALKLLIHLVELQPTVERECLCGSAYKRLSMVEDAAKCLEAERSAIQNMKKHYGNAEKLAYDTSYPDLYYPALNRFAAELVVEADKTWEQFDANALATVRKDLNEKIHNDPGFWSIASLIELRIYEGIARKNLDADVNDIANEFEDLHRRAISNAKWKSIRDQGQFVLNKYSERIGGKEKEAAVKLLKRMDIWAGIQATDPGNLSVQSEALGS